MCVCFLRSYPIKPRGLLQFWQENNVGNCFDSSLPLVQLNTIYCFTHHFSGKNVINGNFYLHSCIINKIITWTSVSSGVLPLMRQLWFSKVMIFLFIHRLIEHVFSFYLSTLCFPPLVVLICHWACHTKEYTLWCLCFPWVPQAVLRLATECVCLNVRYT